ncbi:MAG: hypothetical protein AAFV59_17600, partial [Pseudomonadota bacterium]
MENSRIFVTMNAVFRDEEKCRLAMEKIVKDAHAVYGVDSHFWFRSKDGKSLFVLEQYKNKKALGKAIRRFTFARISFFRSIKVTDVTVYGTVSNGIKLMFALLGSRYMDFYRDYSKDAVESKESGIQNFERNRIFIATNARFESEEEGELAIKAGVGSAHSESAAKTHFWCRSKDRKAFFLLEQYDDEQALIKHDMANPGARADFYRSEEGYSRECETPDGF